MIKPLFINVLQLIQDPHAFAAQRSLRGRLFFNAMYKLAAPRRYARLRRLCRDIPTPVGSGSGLSLKAEVGFAVWSAQDFSLLVEAVAEAEDMFSRVDINALVDRLPENQPFVSIPISLDSKSSIAKLALSESLIAPFAEYLGLVPILREVGIMYSPNNRAVTGSSQYFHLDGQDVRSLQVFIFLDDVNEENGPLTILPAVTSERIVRDLKYRKAEGQRRVSDEVIASCVDINEHAKAMTGRKGDVLVFDGDRCLHYGSRKATKPRRILHLFYMTPFGFTIKKGWENRFRHIVSEGSAGWERAIVTPT